MVKIEGITEGGCCCLAHWRNHKKTTSNGGVLGCASKQKEWSVMANDKAVTSCLDRAEDLLRNTLVLNQRVYKWVEGLRDDLPFTIDFLIEAFYFENKVGSMVFFWKDHSDMF
uniref:Uncharacterized protein n=1 Tax=Lactuca sativa TaxID=4236 RepID=A0A9R1VDE5_LACSA|nr:hypothetical protein LSAT_V11C500228950 [Lactuca sativa]